MNSFPQLILMSLKRLDGTPVMPTLKTVNLNAFNLSKPVSDEKKNETAKPLVFQTKENIEFGSKSSIPPFLPKTPLQKFKKDVIPGTPQTPELVTMDIRKLISNAMGLKQSQDQRVADKTTPTEPKLTVPISIPGTICILYIIKRTTWLKLRYSQKPHFEVHLHLTKYIYISRALMGAKII